MTQKVLTPEETAAALSGSGRVVVTYPGEVPGFEGVTFSFGIQRVVGAPHVMWDAFPGFDDDDAPKPAGDRRVWHPDMPGDRARGPWRCASEQEAGAMAESLRAENPDSLYVVERGQDEGSTDWIVRERKFDPERYWRYQRARVSGGCYAPRIWFGRGDATPEGWLWYRDIPSTVFQWLFERIEEHNDGGLLASGADGRFPDAGESRGGGPAGAAVPGAAVDAGAGAGG